MKRYIFKTLIISCIVSLFSSCFLFEFTPWEGTSEDVPFDSSKFHMYEVDRNIQFLNLSVDGPMDLYMVKMNPSENAISKYRTRSLVSSGNLSAFAENESQEKPVLDMYRKDFMPAQNFEYPTLPEFSSNLSRSVVDDFDASEVQKAVVKKNYPVGETKDIWVDDGAESEGRYEKKEATLCAVGETCYVWIIDGFYSSYSSNQKINSSKAQDIANKFDEIYDYVRYIFGEEADILADIDEDIYGQYKEVFQDISYVSDTGEMVNIVVYDIFDDYQKSSDGGVYGYFWSKDYFTQRYAAQVNSAAGNSQEAGVINYSNQGKYFYVDSYFVNKDIKGIYSTLAHEFQHMINFGQKVLEPASKGSSFEQFNTWYTEMLSMLCEDMMQSYLDIPDDKSPLARLPYFCAYYPLSGIIDWLEGTDVLFSYATSYTFGAFLARNFGGPELIKEIAQNEYVDQESITKALSKMGYSETFDSVFKKYARALVFDNPNVDYTLNQRVTLNNSYYNYRYPMKAIDIFNVEWPVSETKNYKGPALLYPDSQGNYDLRPYGFTLHAIGYTNEPGMINLEFTRPYAYNEEVYIMAQPCKHDKHE